MRQHPPSNRREFLKTSALAATAFSIVPRHVLGGRGFIPPSEKVVTACVGVGSQGLRVMMDLLKYEELQIVSVCDPNEGCDDYIEWGRHELRNKVRELIEDPSWGNGTDGALCGREPARQIVDACYGRKSPSGVSKTCSSFADYRELLEKEKDLDAVVVCTPDHLHAVVSLAAMKAGKHVFCQKPMTRTVHEAREMGRVARATGVATQVATGNAASEWTRVLSEWVMAGVAGPIREVHNWSARPFWPQGISRPAETPPVPGYLDWDLWLGPAPERPYHPVYQPFVWRGWIDFGGGAIGDMGCYSFDTLFRVLKLEHPLAAEASGSKYWAVQGTGTSKVENRETYPRACLIHFEFPERGGMPPVDIYWYDGGLKPRRPAELERDEELADEGLLLIGDRGKILCSFNGARPRLIPKARMEGFEAPPKTLPRSIGHYEEWIRACKGDGRPAANFEFAGLVTETIQLGNVACLTERKLAWDGPNLKVTNFEAAEQHLQGTYRQGWSL